LLEENKNFGERSPFENQLKNKQVEAKKKKKEQRKRGYNGKKKFNINNKKKKTIPTSSPRGIRLVREQ